MAYSLGARFAPPPKYFTLLDPGAYQTDKSGVSKQNAAPFLSTTPRNTQSGRKLWTQAVYNQAVPQKIPNCTSMMSKQPRFPYEAFSAEDLEAILCKCGFETPCECPTENEKEDIICQGKIKRRLIKGPTPRSILGDEGLSAPSRKDHGFTILPDGSQRRIRKEIDIECPPFYDARVNASTDFYRGWKWSQWSSKRTPKSLEVRPGPADYYFETELTQEQKCAEKVRAFKKKTSKQLRYIDMMQQRQIRDGYPGPANYNQTLPKGTDLKFLGCKAERFSTEYVVSPGPADHWIRRDFDPTHPPDIPCHAVLPESAGFGIKAKRFKSKVEETPGPATYDVNYRTCNFVRCGTAPFGSSANRFQKEIIEEPDEEETIDKEMEKENENETNGKEPCPALSWEFKSKTIRMKLLEKKHDEPSPADLAQSTVKFYRSHQAQHIAPFFSSEGRFQPWYNWIPVFGFGKTPGPAKYCLEKPKCPPTFVRGPLYRAPRFPPIKYRSPSPNEYTINNGIETILATHNHRLNKNIKDQYKFIWNQPKESKPLSIEERETILLNASIALLESDNSQRSSAMPTEEVELVKPEIKPTTVVTPKPKMLRTFLYAHPTANY